MSIEQHTKNTMLSFGLNPIVSNALAQYADKQHPYYDSETRLFTAQKARYSSDFVAAEVQGVNGDFSNWGTYRIRFADVVRPTAAIQRHFDDYKMVLFESPLVEYIRPGTKIRTMGSTWLATNPINISGASGSGVVRRCNAVWNHLDYYGNVVSEPIVVENERANANASDVQESQYITKGYFNVICQYNDFTRQIDTNTRMILGTAAYRVTGYSDFETEFTGDYDTVRLLSFTIRYEEPNDAIDDMENHVAGGKSFSQNVAISASSSLRIGSTYQFSAILVRNGQTAEPTEQYPVSYMWESSDDTVLSVDGEGMVTAVAQGEATITATLEQNPAYSMSVSVTVTESEDGVGFLGTVPQSISAYESVTLTAAYYEDGQETENKIIFTVSGADDFAYSAQVSGNSVTITGYGYSKTPLTVTASYGADSASVEIDLEGI